MTDIQGTAAGQLADLMSDISERCWAAGWMSDLEYALWGIVTGKRDRHYGMGEVQDYEIARLQDLSDTAGGWIIWDQQDGRRFVTITEWRQLYTRASWMP
jgi:hypothetical protein